MRTTTQLIAYIFASKAFLDHVAEDRCLMSLLENNMMETGGTHIGWFIVLCFATYMSTFASVLHSMIYIFTVFSIFVCISCIAIYRVP
ncbi:hypothetical protein B0H63DRAFT_222546 [Podospora didyma]|uniref:Uncharacterized protein n=1 Tax=Podospora didyma TaxID=330526 RepID=A0AAE0KJ81_9PEZI|nr:hypothetical protein B0H63DRAFT_222546 [Podospora didyma]